MMDRHPPMEPERLWAFENDGDSFYMLNDTAKHIVEEVRATKCEHIRFQDALLILIFERWERGIISLDERDRLVKRLFT